MAYFLIKKVFKVTAGDQSYILMNLVS